MSNNISYPEEFEIKEVCNNFIKRRVLNSFMQERGIFVINARTDELADILSHCVLERNSIEELRNNAYQQSIKSSLSGFVMKSSSQSFSLRDLYERARDNDRVLMSKGYKLGNLIAEKREGKYFYRGSLDFEIKKPGRIRFMEGEQSHCEFLMFENNNGEWQVEINSSRSSDGKEVQKLFSQFINKETTSVSTLDIDKLTDKQTVIFFDALIDHGMPTEWRFGDVKALTFRRGRNSKNEEENEDNDNAEDRNPSVLSGIRQAILEGGGLRENAFVKQFEENGCIFTAMTFEFINQVVPEIIHIRAEFKGNPKVFEVSIVDYFEAIGTEAKREAVSLPPKRDLEIRSAFWNQARNIFVEVSSNSSKSYDDEIENKS